MSTMLVVFQCRSSQSYLSRFVVRHERSSPTLYRAPATSNGLSVFFLLIKFKIALFEQKYLEQLTQSNIRQHFVNLVCDKETDMQTDNQPGLKSFYRPIGTTVDGFRILSSAQFNTNLGSTVVWFSATFHRERMSLDLTGVRTLNVHQPAKKSRY